MPEIDIQKIKSRCYECCDCWIWTGFARDKRDPQMRANGKTVYVRRLIYELAIGTIAAKRQIVPKCGAALCVNPEHLAAKTLQQVKRASAQRGNYAKNLATRIKIASARRKQSSLSLEIVDQIRAGCITATEVSSKYSICKSQVNKIKSCSSWVDYSNPFGALFMKSKITEESQT